MESNLVRRTSFHSHKNMRMFHEKLFTQLRILFQMCMTFIFLQQAVNAWQRYFDYPEVIQTSERIVGHDEKPSFRICSKHFFNYSEARRNGYPSLSLFLGGGLQGSTIPTWKGNTGDLKFLNYSKKLFVFDYSRLEINVDYDKQFLFHHGFCLETSVLTEETLSVITKEKDLRIYPFHATTDLRITDERSSGHGVTLDVGEDSPYHYWGYEITYEVYDNTIDDGASCVDYRKLQESYGDCLFRNFKDYVFTVYGCYPPWIATEDDPECEIDKDPHRIENDRYKKVWSYLDALTDGTHIEIMKKCQQPCYFVKYKLIEKVHYTNIRQYSSVKIRTTSDKVTVYKAAYSYDFYALITELGSGLGLWLGNYYFICHLVDVLVCN